MQAENALQTHATVLCKGICEDKSVLTYKFERLFSVSVTYKVPNGSLLLNALIQSLTNWKQAHTISKRAQSDFIGDRLNCCLVT